MRSRNSHTSVRCDLIGHMRVIAAGLVLNRLVELLKNWRGSLERVQWHAVPRDFRCSRVRDASRDSLRLAAHIIHKSIPKHLGRKPGYLSFFLSVNEHVYADPPLRVFWNAGGRPKPSATSFSRLFPTASLSLSSMVTVVSQSTQASVMLTPHLRF